MSSSFSSYFSEKNDKRSWVVNLHSRPIIKKIAKESLELKRNSFTFKNSGTKFNIDIVKTVTNVAYHKVTFVCCENFISIFVYS